MSSGPRAVSNLISKWLPVACSTVPSTPFFTPRSRLFPRKSTRSPRSKCSLAFNGPTQLFVLEFSPRAPRRSVGGVKVFHIDAAVGECQTGAFGASISVGHHVTYNGRTGTVVPFVGFKDFVELV